MFLWMPAMTTHEMKCGNVNTVWYSFLMRGWRSSLSASARMMAVGNCSASLPRLKMTVLRSARMNSLSVKKSLKLFNPTKVLPQMPPL